MKAPKSEEPYTFIDFAHTEGRFAKQFDKDGKPSDALMTSQQAVLRNWLLLKELAGMSVS